MTARLCVAFFASGASALVFETLWFRATGLMLGNSIWASSLVISSFMAGLALGNALAGRLASRLRRPVAAYALLELTIALSGVGLVLLLPALTRVLAPAFATLLGSPATLNAIRAGLAFALLLVPATAMGATLPLLARALAERDPHFGHVLGRLYGWNTLGGVVGALAGEAWLIERCGIRGSAALAALLNLLAAGLAASALVAARHADAVPERARQAPPSRRLVGAAFLCGALVLALEVLWFRLLLLFVYGTSLAFAVMLAVVLAGIAMGGLLAGHLLRGKAHPRAFLPALALGAGAVTALCYAALPETLAPLQQQPLATPTAIARLAIALMLPTCLASGVLFTFLGAALHTAGGDAARSSGRLTLANTLGAMLGAPLSGLVLLPWLGVEASILALAGAYGLVAALTFERRYVCAGRGARLAAGVSALAFAGSLALFPTGLMQNLFVRQALSAWTHDGSRLVAFKEGVTESIAYLARRIHGETLSVRLVTNAFSMSSSEVSGQRYMKLFVYWPVAVRPEPRRALLISYGVGMTARALADTRSLQRIDVVDISRDILAMGRHVFPAGGFPLDDPRVSVHVEDGRFFLLASDATWDVITSEPPPPKNAGIVNLYTREYFTLIRRRLAPGGVATYWLPVYQMRWEESAAITRAFCLAFEDCSLWTGYGLEWMLAGTAGIAAPASEEAFTRQWRDPGLAPTLAALGLETPERLGATFLAGPETLREIAGGTAPLEDDHPLRLTPRPPGAIDPRYLALMDVGRARQAFADSALVRRLWPEALRERSLAAFDEQGYLNQAMGWREAGRGHELSDIAAVLRGSTSRFPALIALRTSEAELATARAAAARGEADPIVDFLLGLDALADRDYPRAALALQSAALARAQAERAEGLRSLALQLAPRDVRD